MLARNHGDSPEDPQSHRCHERFEIVAALCRAEALMERDPDAAALELDGLLPRILAQWQPQLSHVALLAAELAALDAAAPRAAMRLRLALRAPNVQVRAAHLWQLVGEAFPDDTSVTRSWQSTPAWASDETARL